MLPNHILTAIATIKHSLRTETPRPICTLSLSRNLSVSKFVPCLSKENKRDVLETIAKQFSAIEGEEFFVLPLKDLPIWQRECLLEHYLFPYHLGSYLEGEALIVNQAGTLLAGINLRDHLVIHGVDFVWQPEVLLQKLIDLDIRLQQSLSFAFSSDFGFLTADPLRCGTALIARAFVHVPALKYGDALSELLVPYQREFASSSLLPLSQESLGDILCLSNICSLGLSEEQILSSLRLVVSKILSAEKEARNQLVKENPTEIKNRILRSVGMLTHSCCLDLQEALDATSWIQLGMSMQWIEDSEKHPLWNPLFWDLRRGHLALYNQDTANRSIEKEVIAQIRAKTTKPQAERLIIRI
ncbi:protein arginine kinase [Chlamydia trachomatis]|uniref:Arginine kinase n=3 Tax=Chlamydia trachomatis TaxID=813 RepID=G4NN62_CHLT4|nr:protein arginine kinase [Chlamydia trachomatis]AEP35560.1 Arginine kinase [Chlamydia trachomatis A2497]AFU23809.1 ATP:guanido phosphotransferase [Chlamydia trachomatis]AHC17533.1 ATP:guanido phosphotransferase [Chlamydia trachomatis C/TW-3]CAX09347.1 aspartate kinase [Chlamydia trachomatis A2497]CCP48073.1 ATP:guanido phosphotransferase [Chlamydia trachomatis A/363]